MYLRGALHNAHFHRMRKVTIQPLHAQEKPWQIYRHKLSIISKHNQLMSNELRYQVKIHAISDMPRKEKKFLAISPPFLFLFLFFFKKKHDLWKQHHRNQSLDILFMSSPISTCKFSQEK